MGATMVKLIEESGAARTPTAIAWLLDGIDGLAVECA